VASSVDPAIPCFARRDGATLLTISTPHFDIQDLWGRATLTTELRNELTKRLANARALLESSGERQYRRSKVG